MYILCHEVGPRLLWRLTWHDDQHSRCPSKNEEDQGQVYREHLEGLLTAALSLTSSWQCARFALPCQGQACWSISSTMFCSISSRWYIHIDDCSALSIDLLMIRRPTGSPVDDQELALKQNKWGFVEVISRRKSYYFIVSMSKISARNCQANWQETGKRTYTHLPLHCSAKTKKLPTAQPPLQMSWIYFLMLLLKCTSSVFLSISWRSSIFILHIFSSFVEVMVTSGVENK